MTKVCFHYGSKNTTRGAMRPSLYLNIFTKPYEIASVKQSIMQSPSSSVIVIV